MQNTLTKKSGRGGARAGAGRPCGSVDKVTINGLLQRLAERTNNQDYEAMLVEDFLQARATNDTQLTLKYHTLILNKVMPALNRVEVTNNENTIEAKQAAFSVALAQLIDSQKR